MIDLHDAAERAAAAGEYVLGTLTPEDHQQVLDALATDAALRAEVAHWQDRLLALSARTPAVQPDPGLWPRIEAGLVAAGTAATAPAAAAASPAPRAARPHPAEPSPPWWQRLGLWQGLSAAAVAASVAMAVLLVGQLGPAGGPAGPSGGQLASQARYVAMLQSPDGQDTGWVVEATAGGTVRLVPAGTPADIPAGRVWQFWTKAEGAAGPTSLGLVKARQTVELPVSALPELSERQLFEITLEPEGGSPIGRPTGPILYVGRSVRL